MSGDSGNATPFQPLVGIRVIELSYGIAAPVAARYLAVLGAEVVRIESMRRPDGLRQHAPAWLPPDIPPAARLDATALFETTTAGKRSAVLELDHAGGRDAFMRLLRTADVFITNFAPRALEKLALTRDRLQVANPRLITVAISTFGDRDAGEFRDYRTWGHNVGAFCGLFAITGFPDDPPLMWSINYTDYIGAFGGAAAALAALAQRRWTGKGAWIELAIHELVAAALGDDFEMCLNGGPELVRRGNSDPEYLCEDVFALRDKERWLALSIRNVEDLALLRAALATATIPHDIRGADLRESLASVFAAMSAAEVQAVLRDVPIPWEIVASLDDVVADRRLQRDGFWQLLPHRRLGTDLVPALPFIVEGERLHDRASFPALGEHTADVLREIGYTEAEIAVLAAHNEVGLLPLPEVQYGPRPWLRAPMLPLGLAKRTHR
jgi:crotonobetainyl-CoA:carnitine CoA-transferase CaiB-like acyl-CoA transferase